jgi:hypothetical protein
LNVKERKYQQNWMEQCNNSMVNESPNNERIIEYNLVMSCDEASNTRGRGTYTRFGRKYPKKRYHLEDTHSDERMKK